MRSSPEMNAQLLHIVGRELSFQGLRLRPCPFCGCPHLTVESHGRSCNILCDSCEAEGPVYPPRRRWREGIPLVEACVEAERLWNGSYPSPWRPIEEAAERPF